MMASSTSAVVIGGGFYGVNIALYLAQCKKQCNVILIEQESQLFNHASYNNQARVHNGYHYPRSFTTAYRSRINFPKFIQQWPEAIKEDFTKIYAIARNQSKVTARQFVRFCQDIGAAIEKPEPALKALFNKRLIEDVFLVQEYAFNSDKLKIWAQCALREAGVAVLYESCVTAIEHTTAGKLLVRWKDDAGDQTAKSDFVFNCTYSGLNQYTGDFKGTQAKLKHEITEMALLDCPAPLKNMGITVMDGAFFSMMPFPALNLHTLSHVRYTPHFHWEDSAAVNPYQVLSQYHKQTRVNRMLRDAERYIPSIANAQYKNSLFEVKTILTKNEIDDGRPIFFEKCASLPGLYSVMGGKLDNIFDILDRIKNEI